MDDESVRLGIWRPVAPHDAAGLFTSLNAPWWIAGGHAIDLFLGQSVRQHRDMDVGMLRRDVPYLREALSPWEIFEARSDTLTRLTSDDIHADTNSLWCRPTRSSPWSVEVL